VLGNWQFRAEANCSQLAGEDPRGDVDGGAVFGNPKGGARWNEPSGARGVFESEASENQAG
jgi:hypothetical protein